ncbi:hypothetical protein CDAR_206421 [Caerostris darwini]|uniref:Uncharacterized protein n=1 Tax=Caerostris darwini TaxID=1538125 RepID=A0AAV4RK85_9ARAC|nr:hypothetical protein CDAR_206421 [Caerostris darwini]
MRLHYLSPKKSPKHSLPVIICHATALKQRGMGLLKLRLINRQPSSNEFKVDVHDSFLNCMVIDSTLSLLKVLRGKVAFSEFVGSDGWKCGIFWLVAMGFAKRETATECDCFVGMFDLPPRPSGFGISPVNGKFFN